MTATEVEFCEVEVPEVLVVQAHGKSDFASIGTAIRGLFQKLGEQMGRYGLTPVGLARMIYDSSDASGVSFRLAIPVAKPAAPVDESVELQTLAGAKTYRFSHHGPYGRIMQTYGHITEFMKAQGWMQSEADWAKYMPMWEEYANDPATTAESELLTYIYLPINA